MTKVDESTYTAAAQQQEKAREEIRSLNSQKERDAVSNDELTEKLACASANSEGEKKEMEEIFKQLLEGKERVEWKGQKFKPKPEGGFKYIKYPDSAAPWSIVVRKHLQQ